MLKICNIVIVGGEGDLAFRKLYPALYSLHKENLLASCTKIVCFGRGKYSEADFKATMREWTEKSGYVAGVDDDSWSSFCDRSVHFIGDATNPDDMKRLRSDLGEDEIVFYLSTPPSIFAPICRAMGSAGVVSKSTRLVVEKPLGTSQESFEKINNTLFETFEDCLLYTSPSPRDLSTSRMPSSA